MGNVQSESVHYLPKNRFRLRFDGETMGEFESANGINASEIGVMEIHGGESNIVSAQSAGKKKWEPLVLTQGAMAPDSPMFAWYDQVVDASGQGGDPDPEYKRIVELDQLDRDGSPVITWTYYEAFPTKLSEGDFDAKANEFRMVSTTITFKYLKRGPAQT